MEEELRRGSRLGSLELLLRVGRGGMATVWVARRRGETRDQDRLVAVKAILPELAEDPEFVKMFLDEGRLVQSIHHPAVVDTFEVATYDGVTCMVMEWVEGDSLHTLIAEAGKRRPIPPEMAVRMIADAAAGLHAAHEARDDAGQLLGVVHRDVSPHNILISTAGAVKLVDFGVAKAMGRLTEATSAGQLKGKFGYMSPEQAMAKPVDRRSDVFSLGIVLFELTTGRRLFRGEHDAETLHLVVGGDIPPPTSIDPSYPPALERIVLKALERDLERRYQTAGEFQAELEQYLKAERILVPPAGLARLLMKVLGGRIEQRRTAIRATLKQLDGDASSATTSLMPSAELLIEGDVSHSGLSSAGSTTGSEPSGPSTTHPQTVTLARGGRAGGVSGYVFGIAGLAVGLAVVLFVVLGRDKQGSTTTVNAVAPTAVAAAPPAPSPAGQPALPASGSTASAEAPELGLERLPALPTAPRGAARPASAPAPAAAPAVKPKPAPPKSQSGSFQRDNPYGH